MLEIALPLAVLIGIACFHFVVMGLTLLIAFRKRKSQVSLMSKNFLLLTLLFVGTCFAVTGYILGSIDLRDYSQGSLETNIVLRLVFIRIFYQSLGIQLWLHVYMLRLYIIYHIFRTEEQFSYKVYIYPTVFLYIPMFISNVFTIVYHDTFYKWNGQQLLPNGPVKGIIDLFWAGIYVIFMVFYNWKIGKTISMFHEFYEVRIAILLLGLNIIFNLLGILTSQLYEPWFRYSSIVLYILTSGYIHWSEVVRPLLHGYQKQQRKPQNCEKA